MAHAIGLVLVGDCRLQRQFYLLARWDQHCAALRASLDVVLRVSNLHGVLVSGAEMTQQHEGRAALRRIERLQTFAYNFPMAPGEHWMSPHYGKFIGVAVADNRLKPTAIPRRDVHDNSCSHAESRFSMKSGATEHKHAVLLTLTTASTVQKC